MIYARNYYLQVLKALAGICEALLFHVRAGQWLSMSDAFQVEVDVTV
jgi:hypothetical protein